MAHSLRALAIFPDNLSSVLITHIGQLISPWNSTFKASFDILGHEHIIHATQTHLHLKLAKIKPLKDKVEWRMSIVFYANDLTFYVRFEHRWILVSMGFLEPIPRGYQRICRHGD